MRAAWGQGNRWMDYTIAGFAIILEWTAKGRTDCSILKSLKQLWRQG